MSPFQLEVDTEHVSFEETADSDSDCSDRKDGKRAKHHQTENTEMIQTVNKRFRKAVFYCTYRLEDRSTKYNHTASKKISKTVKRFTARTNEASHI